MELGKTREEMQALLIQWRAKAIEQRMPWERVAEQARDSYGSRPEMSLSVRAPSPHRNEWKRVVQVMRNKLIEGDFFVTVSSRYGVAENAIPFLQNHIDSIFSSTSALPMVQMALQDACMYGSCYVYVHGSKTIEFLNWFDVYLDALKATPRDIAAGRVVFIRRLVDANDFWSYWEDELRALGYTDAKTLPKGGVGLIPGRRPVGVNASVLAVSKPSERKTATRIEYLYGDPPEYSGADILDAGGLVEEWECFHTSEASPSGWLSSFMFDNKLLADPQPTKSFLRGLPIAAMFADSLNGHVYQPSVYVDVIRNQAVYNWIGAKEMQILSLIENPALRGSKKNKDLLRKFKNTPGEVLLEEDGTEGTTGYLLGPAPSPEYDAIKQLLLQDLAQQTGVNEATTGDEGKTENDKSGRAIQLQQQKANVRFTSLYASRDEWLRDICRLVILYLYDENYEKANKQYESIATEYEGAFSVDPSLPPPPQIQSGPTGLMPEPLRGLSHGSISKDLAFAFRVVPPATREDKLASILTGVVAAASIAPNDPLLQIRIAGIITGNREEAKEIEAEIQKRQLEMIDEKIAVAESQLDETQGIENAGVVKNTETESAESGLPPDLLREKEEPEETGELAREQAALDNENLAGR